MEKPVFLINDNSSNRFFGYDVEEFLQMDSTVDFKEVDTFISKNKGKHIFTFLSYDIKNSIEKLFSDNTNFVPNPALLLWCPSVLIQESEEGLNLLKGDLTDEIKAIYDRLLQEKSTSEQKFDFRALTSTDEYLLNVIKLKDHIQKGDIYEINYCQSYIAESNKPIDPQEIYQVVNSITKAPFSAFVKWNDFALACGSPERYIEKKRQQIISQPIKGTAKRGETNEEDKLIIEALANDPKERAENVMIVDLVRNDLSRIAQKGSVRVPELFGIYTFPTVHQMISTVSCEVANDITFSEILKATFPMGSMTGAPKIRAMELIEQYENFKRGIYSGSVGMIFPNGDFDSNVIIRSIAMDLKQNRLSCSVGGAITIDCVPEKELEECQIKIGRILAPFQCK